MGLMNGSQLNLLGKMQNKSFFTARLNFEPTTQMICLGGSNSLVLGINSICVCKVSDLSLTFHLHLFFCRASLAIHRLNLALAYFEKAVGNVIAAKGDGTPDLISLYEEVAQIEQLRRNHDKAIQYLKQAHSICVSSFTEVSPQTAEASALLARAYAMSGEPQHKDAIETYYIKSISAYQVTLGSEDSETLATIEEFCKWLVQNGEKQEAYRLLKSLLKSQVISYGDCSEKVAETFYNMARICFAEGELGKAIQLLRKGKHQFIPMEERSHSRKKEFHMQGHRSMTEAADPRSGMADTQIFQLPLHSLNACNSQGWARLKSETGNSVLVSQVGCRDPSTWAIIYCLGRCASAGRWTQRHSWSLNTGYIQYGLHTSQVTSYPLCQRSTSVLIINLFEKSTT
ncbi:tetratricopeptide repeat protein 23-like isoform X1 [Lepus europaeus]|uniref:tetratricopeptide repeat protein 23-like isoform X1 n=1 Tax=Lepus europaeus TaxID=9983 RepID=UPI002B48CE56|nr:tetratricopeptide repeat protein 23-like isoform X1 [Lepus europaeus]